MFHRIGKDHPLYAVIAKAIKSSANAAAEELKAPRPDITPDIEAKLVQGKQRIDSLRDSDQLANIVLQSIIEAATKGVDPVDHAVKKLLGFTDEDFAAVESVLGVPDAITQYRAQRSFKQESDAQAQAIVDDLNEAIGKPGAVSVTSVETDTATGWHPENATFVGTPDEFMEFLKSGGPEQETQDTPEPAAQETGLFEGYPEDSSITWGEHNLAMQAHCEAHAETEEHLREMVCRHEVTIEALQDKIVDLQNDLRNARREYTELTRQINS